MVLLAHIREEHRLSLGSYGRPRMTEELKDLGFAVGHRRVGRLMHPKYPLCQHGVSFHFLLSLRSAFAIVISFRIMAVITILNGFPASIMA